MAVAMRHARERLPSIRQFVANATPALDAVIATSTAIAPDRRYPDLHSMVAALHAAVPAGPQPVVVDDGSGATETLIIPIDAEPTITVATRKPPRRSRRTSRRSRGIATGGAPRRKLPVIVGALLLVLAAGTFAAWNWVLAPVVAAPPIETLSVDGAEAAVKDAGLVFEVTDEQHSTDVAKGKIVAQDPPAGEGVRRGGVVAAVVSLGPASAALPNVEGKPGDRSVALLEGAPILADVKVERVFSDTVEKGRVIDQRPAAGKTVLQGSGVTLRISKGIEQVKVPGVVGSAQGEAEAALSAAKLRFSVEERYSDKVPEAGTVISQNLRPATTVDKDTTVVLTVSLGPATITLDDYVGSALNQTRQALQAAGMDVRVYEQARPQIGPTRRGQFGMVEAQVPEPGTRLKRGETVTLYTFSASAEAQEEGD